MSAIIFPLFASAIVFVLYLVLLATLLRKYKSTGEAGFVWLGLAVIVWPILSNLLGWGGHALIEHIVSNHLFKPKASQGAGLNPTDSLSILLDFVRQFVGIILLLISVHFLAVKRTEAEPASKR
jgi:hypothetical protein